MSVWALMFLVFWYLLLKWLFRVAFIVLIGKAVSKIKENAQNSMKQMFSKGEVKEDGTSESKVS